jgi:hypothetical protein
MQVISAANEPICLTKTGIFRHEIPFPGNYDGIGCTSLRLIGSLCADFFS